MRTAWELAASGSLPSWACEIPVFRVALGQEYNDVLGTWTRQREVTDARLRARPPRPVRRAGGATTFALIRPALSSPQ